MNIIEATKTAQEKKMAMRRPHWDTEKPTAGSIPTGHRKAGCLSTICLKRKGFFR